MRTVYLGSCRWINDSLKAEAMFYSLKYSTCRMVYLKKKCLCREIMPWDRETDKELWPGLPLLEGLCGFFSWHLHLWLQAPLPMVAGGCVMPGHRNFGVATCCYGSRWGSKENSHGDTTDSTIKQWFPPSSSPLFLSRHIMDLNMNAVKEKNYWGLSESLR
jgi:hypothetical protein